jgi:hypothetical protein
MEAKELARHADIRQTAKYTHIGMEDRAEALGNLPSPDVSAHVDRLHYVCISGGVLGQEMSPAVSEPDRNARPRNEQTPDCSGVVSSSVVNWHQKAVYSEVEAAGIAPASRDPSMKASTCVSDSLIVGLVAPIGGVAFGLSHYLFNPSRNGRLGSDDPALASSGEASGRRPATKPFLLLRQPYGERESSRQINFGPLFTRPADQPRHATIHVSNPVDPGSPPNCQRAMFAMTPQLPLWHRQRPSQPRPRAARSISRLASCFFKASRLS